jgi:hypothetical protein
MVQLYSGELLSGGERIIDTDDLLANSGRILTRLSEYGKKTDIEPLPDYNLRLVSGLKIPMNYLLDKWFATVEASINAIRNDALTLSDFKTVGRFLSGFLENDCCKRVNSLFDFSRQASIIGDEDLWCLIFEETNAFSHALLIDGLEQVSESNSQLELEIHRVIKKLNEELGQTRHRIEEIDAKVEQFQQDVQKIRNYRERAQKANLSEREKKDMNLSVERIKKYKEGELDTFTTERKMLEGNLASLQLRIDALNQYRELAIIINMLISKRSAAIMRESIRRMRDIFASLIENTAPPEVDKYVSYSDSSVERQERSRNCDLQDLRAGLNKLSVQLRPVLMVVHDFYFVTHEYQRCPLNVESASALRRILRKACAQLG